MSDELPIHNFVAALSSAGKRFKCNQSGQHEAQCPAHDDKRASLGFREAEGGKLLIHCQAGCTPQNVVSALGLRMTDLYAPRLGEVRSAHRRPRPAPAPAHKDPRPDAPPPDQPLGPEVNGEAPAPAAQPKKRAKGAFGPVIAEYIYRDESGAPLMRVTRHDPKDFMRWRPDPAKTDGWCKGGTGDIPAVVYRLPEVRAAISRGETIYVVEGEKDVEALESLGVVATCNAGGAGTLQSPKWLPAHTECLRGAELVVVIPDNDPPPYPGRWHAKSILKALAAAQIPAKGVALPELLQGDVPVKDAHDWVTAAKPTRAQLEQLAEAGQFTAEGAGPQDSGPVPLPERPPPPVFPLEELPQVLRQFCTELAEELQVPVDMPAMLALAALALAVAKKARVNPWDNWIEPLCLWVLSVSEPGTRKSAVFERVLEAVVEYERTRRGALGAAIKTYLSDVRIADQYVKKCERAAGAASTDEKRKKAREELKAANEARDALVPVTAPRFFTSDTTMEALADLLKDHGGRFGIFGPEARKILAIILGKYDKTGASADYELLLKGHAGEDARVDRKNGGETHIEQATITVGLMAQPTVLPKLKAADDGSGLTARFAYVVPEFKKPSERLVRARPVSTTVRDNFKNMLTGLLEWHPRDEVLVHLTEDATAALLAFAGTVQKRQDQGEQFAKDPRLLEWSSKLVGLVSRIAALLHLAERSHAEDRAGDGVDHATMLNAIQIGEYLAKHAARAMNVMEDDEAWLGAHAILKWIESAQHKSFFERDVMRSGPKRWRRQKPLRDALRVLEEYGWIHCTSEDRRSFNLAFAVMKVHAAA